MFDVVDKLSTTLAPISEGASEIVKECVLIDGVTHEMRRKSGSVCSTRSVLNHSKSFSSFPSAGRRKYSLSNDNQLTVQEHPPAIAPSIFVPMNGHPVNFVPFFAPYPKSVTPERALNARPIVCAPLSATISASRSNPMR